MFKHHLLFTSSAFPDDDGIIMRTGPQFEQGGHRQESLGDIKNQEHFGKEPEQSWLYLPFLGYMHVEVRMRT